MPAIVIDSIPKIHHTALDTTFTGVEHPLSAPDARIHQYRGIKYASVPERFRQSRLWTKYPAVTDASKHGPICPQIRNGKGVEAMLGLPADAIPKEILQQDEFECLNLTITSPAGLTPQSHLPVMLWIHGGGDRGHGSHWLYDGGGLVRKSMAIKKPVIVVAINFRIGLFGFTASSHLGEDGSDEGVGNYGLRDQRKAMEWLHQYISGFGGDPNNITIFGASTGGADIICHLLSSENETLPLFHRAVVQSAIVEPIIPDIPTASWHLSRTMAALRLSTVNDLRSIEAERLVGAGMTFRAVDDGIFFRQGWQEYFGGGKEERPKAHKIETHMTRTVQKTRSKSRSALRSISRSRSRSTHLSGTPQLGPHVQHQPLIIGDCSCDSLLWSIPASLWTPGAVVRRLRAVCQTLSKANNLLRAYDITPYTPDDEILDHVLDLINDARVAWPTECISQLAKRDRGGQGVFRYVFDQESPSRGVPHHASDLMYLFDNVSLDSCNNHSVPDSFMIVEGDSPKFTTTPTPTAAPTPQILLKSHLPPTPADRGRLSRSRTLRGCPSDETDFDEDLDIFFDSDSEDESISTPRSEDDFDWMQPVVDEWSYSRVRDAMQEKWITFAQGEAPWKEDKVFVFGPEGETGERSMSIFEGRRRKQLWREALAPLGPSLVQKIGLELSRGPSGNCGR
ncbi:hypothetical protein AX15_005649 [Amanita polypyramis BW_CC]|nr:hypothetical protein AX15_005649 [Amanita polypyramis BW_CC]